MTPLQQGVTCFILAFWIAWLFLEAGEGIADD